MAILWVDTHTSGFNVFQINYFLLFGTLLFLAYLIYRITMQKKRLHSPMTREERITSDAPSKWVMLSVCLLLSMGIVLEQYYYFSHCSIDQIRLRNTENLALLAHKVLSEHMNVDHSFIEGTVLSILRGNDGISVWDQDADILIEYPSSVHQFVNRLKHYLHKYDQTILIKPDLNRNFIQLVKQAAHIDLWMYLSERHSGDHFAHLDPSMKGTNDIDCLVTYDYTNVGGSVILPRSWVFPVKSKRWMNVDVPIPNQFDKYCRHVFDDRYLIPYYNRFQCFENIFTSKVSGSQMIMLLMLVVIFTVMLRFTLLKDRHFISVVLWMRQKCIFKANGQKFNQQRKSPRYAHIAGDDGFGHYSCDNSPLYSATVANRVQSL